MGFFQFLKAATNVTAALLVVLNNMYYASA